MSSLWVRDPYNRAAELHGTLWICLGTNKLSTNGRTYTKFKSVADGAIKGFDISMGLIKPAEE